MILLEAGEPSDKAFDAKIVFAMTLCARGHRVAIDQKTLPPELARAQRYEVAPFLCDVETIEISRILVIGAENLSGDTLLNLRSLRLGAQVPVTAIGSFSDHQTQISSRSKLAYCLGREPEVIDLRDLHQKTLIPAPMTPLLAPPPPVSHRQGKPNVFIFVPDEVLEDPATLPILTALDNHAEFRLGLILSGKGHEATRAARFPGLTSYASRDVSPMALAQLADVAVFLGEAVPDERMAVFAIALMRAARVLVDCTSQRGFLAGGAPALQGPMELAGLANFLTQTVMVNRAEIGRQTGVSPWLASHGIERLEQALGLPTPDAAKLPGASGPIMFHPTNGVGLGHARRCLEIAAAMTRPAAAAFAAFPSCLPMVAAQGHACVPLVQKSPFHSEEYANDILNYIRFRQILREGSVFVFDGGFVFDSVCRIIQEKSLSGVWIRRGLWQPGQITATTLEREKVFGKVIVPDEAFDELNTDYSFGRHVHHVGPILHQKPSDPAAATLLRSRLAERFAKPFDQLIVTMLGGGVAADRSAQLQTLCNLFEQRDGCLHLIIVWPGGSISPGLFGWKNTVVVQTRHALALCQAADLVVSAAGYNAFHELLYHGIPAILIPQMAAFMDDQQRRARAASERGFAETVLAPEILRLDREVRAFLDDGKAGKIRAALQAASLPAIGNRAAAALIESEVPR